jgi:HlyD family secretion protein
MAAETQYPGAGWRLAKRAFSLCWKLAIVAIVAAVVVYRLRYAPVPVDTHVVVLAPITEEVTGTGTLEARVSAIISPKISGLVTQVLADQGDRTTKGQLLATLYDGDLREQLEIAKADLAATKAGVDRAAADIASAEATATQARAAYGRDAQLASKKFVSPEDLEKSQQQREIAEALLKRAHATKVEIDRQVIKGEETQRYYEERLADTTITSPFDGLVVRRTREPGDIAVPGSEILQVISTDEMWVSAWVDETAMASVAVDQPARVVFRSSPEKPYSGTVARMSPLTDRETREFLVDVTVKELPKTWAVGQRAEVYIQTAKKDQALLVPQRAIVWQKGRTGLFVNMAGHAQWQNVTLGLRGTEKVEVTEGLNAGDTVIWLHDAKENPLTEGRAVAVAVADKPGTP